MDVSRRMADLKDGTSSTVVGSEVLAGVKDDCKEPAAIWDARGLWAWPMMGSFCYTHRYTPNSSVGDTMWYNPGQDIECVSDPFAGMPCNTAGGTNYETYQAAARSRHLGGVNAVFADGHVTFVADTINWNVWRWLGAIADGHAIPAEVY
jgi:prepilin-type processing-associated H-X9-DG protein